MASLNRSKSVYGRTATVPRDPYARVVDVFRNSLGLGTMEKISKTEQAGTRGGPVSRSALAAAFIIPCLIILSFWLARPHEKYEIVIAAGPANGEAHGLLKALQTVVHRHYPDISVEVFVTRDALQNVDLLSEGRVNAASVQADILSDASSRLICELYSDMFQLIARADSGIKSVSDLAGKRVALPYMNSSEYNSFLFVAQHYGLTEKDIVLLPGSDRVADWQFTTGEADAVFRVRGAGNAAILRLIEKSAATIVPIPQADALQLRRPALTSGVIPAGSYRGFPSVPDADTPTVVAKNLLLVRADVPDDVVFKLTSVLFENRRELVELNPIAGFVALPDRSAGTLFPIHPGTQKFVDRDKPSTLQQYAPAIALAVSLSLLYLSASLQIAAWRRRKAMSQFNTGLLDLAERARKAPNYAALEARRAELFQFVEQVVSAGQAGRISTSDLALFNKAYETVEEAIKLRRAKLEGEVFQFDVAPRDTTPSA